MDIHAVELLVKDAKDTYIEQLFDVGIFKNLTKFIHY
jgi:hypothetical protein